MKALFCDRFPGIITDSFVSSCFRIALDKAYPPEVYRFDHKGSSSCRFNYENRRGIPRSRAGPNIQSSCLFLAEEPGQPEDRLKLIEGLKKLSKVRTIREFHIGLPADTNRDVIEHSSSVPWMLKFRNKAEQDKYQADPIHLHFVETCAPLWQKVIVYDSVHI